MNLATVERSWTSIMISNEGINFITIRIFPLSPGQLACG